MTESSYPLVTVIIAFFNDGSFLHETIESVINQEYQNWELLLIDDGSTDGSTSIARKFAQDNNDKIFFIEHPGHVNLGVCVSRNLGVSRARGRYVAILDGDDVWLPKKLSVQVDLFLRHPEISMVCEASEYWWDWQPTLNKNEIVEVGDNIEGAFHPPQLLYELYPLGHGSAPTPSGILLKREAINKIGGFEEQFRGIYQLYEDQAFLVKMYLSEAAYISKLCNHRYRQRAGSVVHDVTKNGKYYVVRGYFLEWFENYFKQYGNKNKSVTKLIRRALVPHRERVRYFFQQLPNRLKDRIMKRLRWFHSA